MNSKLDVLEDMSAMVCQGPAPNLLHIHFQISCQYLSVSKSDNAPSKESIRNVSAEKSFTYSEGSHSSSSTLRHRYQTDSTLTVLCHNAFAASSGLPFRPFSRPRTSTWLQVTTRCFENGSFIYASCPLQSLRLCREKSRHHIRFFISKRARRSTIVGGSPKFRIYSVTTWCRPFNSLYLMMTRYSSIKIRVLWG